MDMNSWKLATDKGLPHSVVVAKLKKYRRWSDKPLMLFREGSHDGAIIYSFDAKHYEDCCRKEKTAVVKRKKLQAVNAMSRLHGKKK
tara:strand:+ start:4948 stop:5208 length:261 start_codon:yes stop_codon:yes gene_type:complete